MFHLNVTTIPPAPDVLNVWICFERIQQELRTRFVTLGDRVVKRGTPVSVFGLEVSTTQADQALQAHRDSDSTCFQSN